MNKSFFHSSFKIIQKQLFLFDSDSLFDFISKSHVLVTSRNYLSILIGSQLPLNAERAFLYSFIIYRFPFEVFEKETNVPDLYNSRLALIHSTKNMLDSLYNLQNSLDSNPLRNSFISSWNIFFHSFLLWKDINRQFVISQTIHKLNKINNLSQFISTESFADVKSHLILLLNLLGVKQEDIPNFPLKQILDESYSIPTESIRKQIISGNFELVVFYLSKICSRLDIPFDDSSFSPSPDFLLPLFNLISNKVFTPDSPFLVQFKVSLHSDLSNLLPNFIDSVFSILPS